MVVVTALIRLQEIQVDNWLTVIHFKHQLIHIYQCNFATRVGIYIAHSETMITGNMDSFKIGLDRLMEGSNF